MYKKIYCPFLFTSAIILLFSFCSHSVYKLPFPKQKDIVIFPSPPDTTRIQFLTGISNSKNLTGRKSAFMKFILGQDEVQQIKKPYGITIHDGKIYICDTGMGGLVIIDLQKQTYTNFIPKGKGELRLPLNCFIDETGNLYIADGERNQIVIFDKDGKYVDSFGEKENFKPTDVFVYDNKIWVANAKNNRISVYNKDTHSSLFFFPESEKGNEDYLFSPTNLFVTKDKVYVSDFGDFKIKTYTLDGKYINSIGSYGNNIGQFVRPKGIAVDRESNLYVVDAGFENTQVFNKDGNLLMHFGGPYTGPGYMWLPAKVAIDYDNLKYFTQYVDESFELKYLIFVTNQYGPDKISIYGAVRQKK